MSWLCNQFWANAVIGGFFLLALFFNLFECSSIAVTQLAHSEATFSVTLHGNNSKHLALIKDIIFGSSFGLPQPATLWVNCVSSSKSLTESFATKFIWEHLFITICISSASGMRFEWEISISEAGSLGSAVEVGAWGGVKVVTALSSVEDTGWD